MKIYTKTGDKGLTQLVGGQRVSKDSDRVAAYGTIDELNSWIGYMVSQCKEHQVELINELQTLQIYLFDIGTDLATPKEAGRIVTLDVNSVAWLEERIDYYTEHTPSVSKFILPGGGTLGAMAHYGRTITRRAERLMVKLNWSATLDPVLIQFVNRSSDYFFALARFLNKGGEEIYYDKGKSVFF